MTTRSDLEAGIMPGSLPHGNRQELVAGLQAAIPGGQAQPDAAPGPGVVEPPMDSTDDPLAGLISGELDPGGGDLPITAGLSVGPGPGPNVATPIDPRQARLQQVAMQAKSPIIRQMARNELRRMVGEAL